MPVSFNTNSLDSVQYNGTNLDVLKLNGTVVWERYNGAKGVTLYGACKIDQNNVLSNFEKPSNFARPTYTLAPIFSNGDSFELNYKITTPSSFIHGTEYIYVSTKNGQALSQQGDKILAVRVYADSNNASLAYLSFQATYTGVSGNTIQSQILSPNTTYYIKFKYDGSTMFMYVDTSKITNLTQPIATENNFLSTVDFSDLNNNYTALGSPIFTPTGQYEMAFTGMIDLTECYTVVNDQIVWKGIDNGLQKYDKQLVSTTPVLLHMDANVTNNGSKTLSWSGQGFLGSSTGGKFNGYNMYAGWYDFGGLTYAVSDDYTIEMWMKTVEYADNYNSFTWGTGSGPTRIFTLELNNKPNEKAIRVVYSNGAASTYSLSSINEWTHVAVTYKGGTSSGEFTLFLNGIKKTTWNEDGSTSGYNTVFNGNGNLVNLGYSGWDEFVVHDYIRYTRNFELQTQAYTI